MRQAVSPSGAVIYSCNPICPRVIQINESLHPDTKVEPNRREGVFIPLSTLKEVGSKSLIQVVEKSGLTPHENGAICIFPEYNRSPENHGGCFYQLINRRSGERLR